MSLPAPETLEREKGKLWVNDSELMKINPLRSRAANAFRRVVALAYGIDGVG